MENKKVISSSLVLVLVLTLSFVLAQVLTPSTYENGLGFSFNETTINNTYNITVNNTQLGAIANITMVNITLPETFTYIDLTQGVGENETVAVFTNTTTTLSWANETAGWFLINGTETAIGGDGTQFWFNASATTPGTYNLTVNVTMANTTVTTQYISVEINDTTAPFNISFTGDTSGAYANLSQNYIIVNVTANDTDGAYGGALANVTYSLFNSSGPLNSTVSTNLAEINFTGLVDGIYYINATVNDTAGNVNTTGTGTRTITLDTTAPAISYLGGMYVNNSNISATSIFVNVSVTELYNDTIVFNLYNGSGSVNSTQYTDGSRNITWTGLINGDYTFNVTVNDSATNENYTQSMMITLDTTAPTATAACTPASANLNDVVTCTCTAADATSGVASSSATTTPSTSSTGTYYYTCSVTDYASNTASSTASYDVSGGSSGSSGSTTTTNFWTKGTQTVTDEQFAESYTKELQVRQRVKVKVETLNHYIGVVGLTATTATINVSSDPQQATLIVGDERRFEVSDDDYYDILVKLNSIENNRANITVKSIHELITEDTVAGEGELQDAGEAATGEDEAVTTEESNVWWYIGGIVIIILVIVGIIYAKKK
ncbi:MAG: hypothetical protein KKF50_05675 [Nanoarchaeota archaeon]|nr:hypothetical protein [Nanoarchaeota archaeon]